MVKHCALICFYFAFIDIKGHSPYMFYAVFKSARLNTSKSICTKKSLCTGCYVHFIHMKTY